MREQAYIEAAVVLAYVLGFNNSDGFIVMEPRGRTRAGEVAWPSSVYNASMLLIFAVAEM